jgi:asparagine N-glycosylation enzyme membrane subunit Stt3
MNQKEMMGYGIFGGVAALATIPLLKFISGLVSKIPGISLDLQSISIGTTGLGGVVQTGLSQYAQKLMGLLPQIPFTMAEWVWTFVGGALFVILGAYLVEAFNIKFAKTKVGKVATVFVVAGIVTGAILAGQLQVPLISGIIVMVIDALLLSWILVKVDEAAKLKLIP